MRSFFFEANYLASEIHLLLYAGRDVFIVKEKNPHSTAATL